MVFGFGVSFGLQGLLRAFSTLTSWPVRSPHTAVWGYWDCVHPARLTVGKSSKSFATTILRTRQKPAKTALLTDFNTRMAFTNSFFAKMFRDTSAVGKTVSLHFQSSCQCLIGNTLLCSRCCSSCPAGLVWRNPAADCRSPSRPTRA